MKPDSPSNEHEESNPFSTMKVLASAMNITADVDRDFDMDDEVMNVMHSHIRKQLIKFTKKDAEEEKAGMMDGDTKAYFDEIIRGSALFGILPDKGGEFDDDDKENNDSYFSENEPTTDDTANDNQSCHDSEDLSGGTARFQLSKILLAKKVAEAFVGKTDGADNYDDDKAVGFLSGPGTRYLSWGARLLAGKENPSEAEDNSADNSDCISHHSIETDLGAERDKLREEDDAPELAKRLESDLAGTIVALWQHRLTQSSSQEGDIDIEYGSEVNSTGPPTPRGDDPSVIVPSVKLTDVMTDGNGNRSAVVPGRLPLSLPGDETYNAALEEIRGRLRKTQFDYASDSGQKTPENKPQVDYRSVLKKKDQS